MNGGWQSLFAMTGGAGAALTGLVFVAVSLNASAILASGALRRIAAQALILLMTPLTTSVIVLLPEVPLDLLAALLVLAGCALGLGLLRIGRRIELLGESHVTQVLGHLTPNFVTSALIVVAGAWLWWFGDAGLYWLVPAQWIALVGGVTAAWLFVINRALAAEPDASGNR